VATLYPESGFTNRCHRGGALRGNRVRLGRRCIGRCRGLQAMSCRGALSGEIEELRQETARLRERMSRLGDSMLAVDSADQEADDIPHAYRKLRRVESDWVLKTSATVEDHDDGPEAVATIDSRRPARSPVAADGCCGPASGRRYSLTACWEAVLR